MANSKISALTSATTPLAGTETLPIVQSSTTKQVSVANVTAGRTVDVNILLANSTNVDGNWKVQANASSSGVTGVGVNNNGGYGAYLTYDNTGRYSGGGAGLRNIANTPIYIETNNTIIGKFDTSGNYVPSTAAKGIDFTANTPAAGMTSQLLNWYEQGTWTPTVTANVGTILTLGTVVGSYTRIGRQVTVMFDCTITLNGTGASYIKVAGIPFASVTYVASGAGKEYNVTDKSTNLVLAAGSTTIGVFFYDGTYPGGNNYRLLGTLNYFV